MGLLLSGFDVPVIGMRHPGLTGVPVEQRASDAGPPLARSRGLIHRARLA